MWQHEGGNTRAGRIHDADVMFGGVPIDTNRHGQSSILWRRGDLRRTKGRGVTMCLFWRLQLGVPPCWKREVDFVQSALRSRLPGPIRSPRFYRVDEHRDDVWVWMERVRPSSSEPWTPDDFRLTAHDLGQWNGACLTRTEMRG